MHVVILSSFPPPLFMSWLSPESNDSIARLFFSFHFSADLSVARKFPLLLRLPCFVLYEGYMCGMEFALGGGMGLSC